MYPSNALVAQGFPVTNGIGRIGHHCRSGETSSFHFLKSRKRLGIFNQAGNSMHVGVIGPVMMFAINKIPLQLAGVASHDYMDSIGDVDHCRQVGEPL